MGYKSVSYRVADNCFEVTLNIKIIPPTERESKDAMMQRLKQEYPKFTEVDLLQIVNKEQKKLDDLDDKLINKIDAVGPLLADKLNKVYGGKSCCCIKFLVNTSQSTSPKYILKDHLGVQIVNTQDKNREGEVDTIGTGNMLYMTSAGLLNDKTFPHEMGHLFGLHHPNYFAATAADRARAGLSDDRSFKRVIKNHEERSIKWHGLENLGYDHDNKISIDPDKNIMGYGKGLEVNCEQINAMINNIKTR